MRSTTDACAHSLSVGFLLALYAVVPLSLLAVGVDIGFLRGALGRCLPFYPESLLWFALFFEVPHVVASSVLLLDRSYVAFYGNKLLLGGAALLAVVIGGPHVVGNVPFAALVTAYTMYHVVGQQCGVVRMLIGEADATFAHWKLFNIAGGTVLMVATFMAGMREEIMQAVHCDAVAIIDFVARYTTMSATVLSILLFCKCDRRAGRQFIVAQAGLLLACHACYLLNYPFFVFLMPRIVHDLTAFTFYIVHDQNRNSTHRVNLVQQIGERLGLPVAAVTPLAALILAYPVTCYSARGVNYPWVYYFLSAMHFFTESFTWKSQNLHRRFVRLS